MTGGAVTETVVRAALDEIKDPCSCVAGAPAGLSEMGLVRDVVIEVTDAGARVAVTLIATEPTCPFATMFTDHAQAAVAALAGVTEANVRFDPRGDWCELDASPDYRMRLNAMRRARGFEAGPLSGSAPDPTGLKGARLPSDPRGIDMRSSRSVVRTTGSVETAT